MKTNIPKWSFVVIWTLMYNLSVAERILSVTFVSNKSHKLTYMPLLEELGKRGHNITILTTYKPDKVSKNVHEILLFDMAQLERKITEENSFNPFENKRAGKNTNSFLKAASFASLCRKAYDAPIIQEILKEKFDLLFLQPLFNECVLGLLYRLKVPIVLFTPVGVPGFTVAKIGGHFPLSFTPNMFTGFRHEMTFPERFYHFGYNVWNEVILRFYYEPMMEAVYREKLGQDIPSISEIYANQAALLLSNGHFTLHRPKPYFPDTVDVGGIHSQPAQPLPEDLKKFVEKGEKGFVYFSMGSAIRATQMPEERRKMFLKVFSKLEQQVLWKWESEQMPDLPENVKLGKWLPQQDILGHKDCRIFITHCGGGGLEEAIYHGTPLIGFPMLGDQFLNAQLAKEHEIMIELDWNTVTETVLMESIQEMLNNSSYSQNVKSLSTLFKDRPQNPMDLAIYHIEYILRHKGAPHLRSVGRQLNILEYHSIDVICAYLISVALISCLIYATCKCVFSTCCRKFLTKSDHIPKAKTKTQ